MFYMSGCQGIFSTNKVIFLYYTLVLYNYPQVITTQTNLIVFSVMCDGYVCLSTCLPVLIFQLYRAESELGLYQANLNN